MFGLLANKNLLITIILFFIFRKKCVCSPEKEGDNQDDLDLGVIKDEHPDYEFHQRQTDSSYTE